MSVNDRTLAPPPGWLQQAKRLSLGRTHRRGLIAISLFLLLWQVGGETGIIGNGNLAPPLDSLIVFFRDFATDPAYWESWLISVRRVFLGFVIAQGLGIPLGILFGINARFRAAVFPIFEILRPIPPLAWVPLSILFWPTTESSIVFITTLGAFFIIAINVYDGIRDLPSRYIWQARSLGAGFWTILWRVFLPALLPAISVGMTLGITVTWNVLIAAEMIASDTGLGRLTWEGYVSGTPTVVIIGIFSIGLAGALSAWLIVTIEQRLMPWSRKTVMEPVTPGRARRK